jgi:hypothetical protein
MVLITLDEEELSSSLRLEFKTTNNEAEYEVVMASEWPSNWVPNQWKFEATPK